MPPPGFPYGGERELRDDLRRTCRRRVLTGGQTGVDTAAALAALDAGLLVHVVFPLGFRQEDGAITPARRRALRGAAFHQLTSQDFAYRTWTCGYLADAVILIDPAGGAGCQETIRAAGHFGRPLLNLGPDASEARPDEIARWLDLTSPRVLMIAGCRQSLLASQDKERDVRAQLDVVVSAFAWPGGRSP